MIILAGFALLEKSDPVIQCAPFGRIAHISNSVFQTINPEDSFLQPTEFPAIA